MPSIKKRVTGFFRQVSGPSQSVAQVSPPPQYEKCFIQRYLAGESTSSIQPEIHHAKTGHSLPVFGLGYMQPEVFAAYTGPQGGLTCLDRSISAKEEEKKSCPGEVDYIDFEDGWVSRSASRRASVAADIVDTFERGQSLQPNCNPDNIRVPKSPVYIDNTVMEIRVMDRVYRVDDTVKQDVAARVSRGSISSGPRSLPLNHESVLAKQTSLSPGHSKIHGGCLNSSSDSEPESPLYKTSEIIDIDSELNLIETEDGYLPLSIVQNKNIPLDRYVSLNSAQAPTRPSFLNLRSPSSLPTIRGNVEVKPINSRHSHSNTKKQFDKSSRISFPDTSCSSTCGSLKPSITHSNTNGNEESRPSLKVETNKVTHVYPELKANQDTEDRTKKNVIIEEETEEIMKKLNIDLKNDLSTSLAGVRHWNRPNDSAFGLSESLYERNPVTGEQAGSPIADTFAVVARKNSAVLVLGDGVNWGTKAALASRAAVYGAMEYLNNALFGVARKQKLTTQDVFQILLRSFHAAHCLIIEQDAMLTTLTAAVVLPTDDDRFHFCVCNVGDSLAYVYSKREVREVTQGSHDITANRDMRDALGALGPVDGVNPELSNLTCSITEVLPGDIVFLTSDGISDNFDPVVGKFCVPKKPERTNSRKQKGKNVSIGRRTSEVEGLPTVEGFQRHHLTLLRIEDILNNAWGSAHHTGNGSVESAAELCQRMLDFCQQLTTAKRKILEDPELYTGTDQNMQDQKLRRRRVCEKLALVPGKLDHATIAAFKVGDRTIELAGYEGDITDPVDRNAPGSSRLSAPHASCEDLTMRDSPDDNEDVTPTPSISLDSTPLASGASSLAATPTHTNM